MRTLYIVTGSCPEADAEARLAMADIREAEGDYGAAQEWREIVAKMRREWEDRDGPSGVRRRLTGLGPPIDPDALIDHGDLTFWHQQGPYDATVVCPCGHFADFLCDEPIGRGRTCDKPLCKCCRHEIADGIDQCEFHATTKPRVPR